MCFDFRISFIEKVEIIAEMFALLGSPLKRNWDEERPNHLHTYRQRNTDVGDVDADIPDADVKTSCLVKGHWNAIDDETQLECGEQRFGAVEMKLKQQQQLRRKLQELQRRQQWRSWQWRLTFAPALPVAALVVSAASVAALLHHRRLSLSEASVHRPTFSLPLRPTSP